MSKNLNNRVLHCKVQMQQLIGKFNLLGRYWMIFLFVCLSHVQNILTVLVYQNQISPISNSQREDSLFSSHFLRPHGKIKEEIGKPTKVKGENVSNSVTEAFFLLLFPQCPKGKDRLLGQDKSTLKKFKLGTSRQCSLTLLTRQIRK